MASSIAKQLEIAVDKKFSAVVVSLSGATYEGGTANGMRAIVKKLNDLSVKLKITIAFIDYSIPLYKHLKTLSKNTQLKLFKNISATKLFLDPKAYKSGMRVLIYDEDKENAKELSKELSKYGYTIVVADDASDFQYLCSNKSSDIIITHSSLNSSSKVKNIEKKNISLSKKLIINLPVFMDTAVETLVSFTGLEAEKLSHSIKKFDLDSSADIVCSVMHFSGDLNGYFALLFPKDIVLIAMESFIGEKIDENDNASIMDGVGEFCNVITGSAKTILSNKNIKVVFELPKTYVCVDLIRNEIGGRNGIWIDMQLAGKPYYMFITE
ncbi:chemotaxis protein CheX [Candidatus Sulfurimonas baltica]|uniref:chemotaxis protein CheX n=1 Tax=Candidatus Sulfurimonas baltica TaxID=2740404 RepID=UPI001E42BA46|nr:chemotaxis protein CheX [Candidatus Sulfurimonas baltica]